MSSTWAAPAAPPSPWPQGLRHVWHSWRSLQRRELGWFLLFGGVIGGLNALALADGSMSRGHPGLVLTETLLPLPCALILLLCWLPADRSDPRHPHRVARLAGAAVAAGLGVAVMLPVLTHGLGLPTVLGIGLPGKPPPPMLAGFVAEFLSMLATGGLTLAVIEMAARRRRSAQALAEALHEHARLTRTTLESRLAAMQAQVEPQFLFDVLVDIERLYGADPASGQPQSAHAQMERLITYLRVALPRLRDSGSTLGAEADLLGSYLDLVQGLRGGHPRFHAELPAGLRGATLHPMLLLPLVQRALRLPGPPPRQIRLCADGTGDGLSLRLEITASALCRSDGELLHLQERLQVLYDGRAGLRCEELRDADGGRCTRFTLNLPR